MRILEFDFDQEEVDQQIAIHRKADDGITPRPYQADAVRNVFDRWSTGDVSTLVSLPTGTGKSVVFSEVMRRWVEQYR